MINCRGDFTTLTTCVNDIMAQLSWNVLWMTL